MYNALELLNAMGCEEIALYPEKYNKSLMREYNANLTIEIKDDESPFGLAYVRVNVIAFSPANIAHFLSFPRYTDITGTVLERDVD